MRRLTWRSRLSTRWNSLEVNAMAVQSGSRELNNSFWSRRTIDNPRHWPCLSPPPPFSRTRTRPVPPFPQPLHTISSGCKGRPRAVHSRPSLYSINSDVMQHCCARRSLSVPKTANWDARARNVRWGRCFYGRLGENVPHPGPHQKPGWRRKRTRWCGQRHCLDPCKCTSSPPRCRRFC